MWPVSENLLQALRGSHEVVVRGSVYFDGVLVADDVRFDSGTIEVDGASMVRRTISGVGVVAADGDTEALSETLSIFGAELQIERGVRFPTGRVETCPIGRFRIDTVEDDLATPGRVNVTGNDLSVRILDDRFVSPRSASRGLTIAEQIERLATQAVPEATVVSSVGWALNADVGRGVVWEEDRLAAIASLAKSVGGVFSARPDGNFAVDPVQTFLSAPVWTVDAGLRGVLVGGRRERSRESVRNYVKAVGSSTSNGSPPFGVAFDNDPASPTYVEGPFGRVPLLYTSEHIRTESQAQSAAEGLLSKALGARSSLSLTTIVNPALEAGDRIDVVLPSGISERHLIDSLSIPLTATEPMTIVTRVKD